MSFQDSVRTVLTQKYAAFDGRARRSEFWWFALFSGIVSTIAMILDSTVVPGTASILQGLVGLALLVPTLAVGARRLHDTGRSGWWQLISLTVIGAFLVIFWFVKEGDTAPNQHGVNPKHVDAVVGAVA